MEIRIKFKSCSSDKIYQIMIRIEEYTPSKITKDGIRYRMYQNRESDKKQNKQYIAIDRNKRYKSYLKKYKYVE